MSATIKEITDSTFENETQEGVTLTDFRADWCPPCKMMDPILQHLSEENQLGGKIKFTSVNIDENKQVASQLGIQGIPTLIIKKNGQVIDKIVGFHPKDEIENTLKSISKRYNMRIIIVGGGSSRYVSCY